MQVIPQQLSIAAQNHGLTAEESCADSGNRTIAWFLWLPGVTICGILVASGYPAVAIVVAGLVLFAHTLFRPIVAAYALIFCIPLETLVSVIPSVATLPKMVALFVAIVSVFRLVRSAVSLDWDPTAKWVVLLLGWASLSLFWSERPQMGLVELQTLILVWTIPLLVGVHITDRQKWRTALLFYVASCLINSLLVLFTGADVSAVVGEGARGHVQTLVGDDISFEGNGPARLNAIAIFACLMYFFTTKAWRKSLAVGATLLLVIGIILFMTRNVFLGVPCSLIAGLLIMRGTGITRRTALFAGILFVGAVCAMLAIKLGLIGQGVQQRFATIFEEGTRAGNRDLMWQGHIHYFVKTGMIGLGVGQVRYTPEALYHVAHNDIIDLAGNLGIIGVVAFVGLHAGLFSRLRKVNDLWVSFFCNVSWIMLLFGGLTQTDHRGKFYTVVLSLLIAALRIDERERVAAVEFQSAASTPIWPTQFSSLQGATRCTSRS